MNCKGKPALRQHLAAEYVLGTLRGRARLRLERWLRDDPELAREVAAWEARLAPMAGTVAPVAPPPRVWLQVERQLEGRKKSSFWKALGLMASGAVAALLVLAVLLPRPPEGLPPSYIAVLSDPKTSQPVLIATVGRLDTALRVTTLDPKIHVAGHSLELWALPQGGQPKSLGVVAGGKAVLKLVAAADQALGNVPALAISLEPPGGSRTGLPTGPVLYSGPCVKYW